MTRTSRLVVALASLLLLAVYVTPLWRIELVAPQYPEGLGLRIWVNQITGLKPNDLNSINGLDGAHADVVVQRVDVREVVLLHPGDGADPDPHAEPLRVLRRHEPDPPQREHVHGEQQRGGEGNEHPGSFRHEMDSDDEERGLAAGEDRPPPLTMFGSRYFWLGIDAARAVWVAAFLLTLAMSGTVDPAGDTRA